MTPKNTCFILLALCLASRAFSIPSDEETSPTKRTLGLFGRRQVLAAAKSDAQCLYHEHMTEPQKERIVAILQKMAEGERRVFITCVRNIEENTIFIKEPFTASQKLEIAEVVGKFKPADREARVERVLEILQSLSFEEGIYIPGSRFSSLLSYLDDSGSL